MRKRRVPVAGVELAELDGLPVLSTAIEPSEARCRRAGSCSFVVGDMTEEVEEFGCVVARDGCVCMLFELPLLPLISLCGVELAAEGVPV